MDADLVRLRYRKREYISDDEARCSVRRYNNKGSINWTSNAIGMGANAIRMS